MVSINAITILTIVAFIMVLLSAIERAPLLIAVFLLALIELLRAFG
jgi:heme/copper-type cytochrome/quinol oxidase subunit 4